ncbi:MAG: Jag N-terminal domain-containing protein [Firmicutes bacterium]|nr:Jag N-terminal domain-containing protein [Bacillota bacterium]
MISIESSAKTVKQAIEDGLKRLDKTIDEVEIKIVTNPGIFRKAKVIITVEGSVAALSAVAEQKPIAPKQDPALNTKHPKGHQPDEKRVSQSKQNAFTHPQPKHDNAKNKPQEGGGGGDKPQADRTPNGQPKQDFRYRPQGQSGQEQQKNSNQNDWQKPNQQAPNSQHNKHGDKKHDNRFDKSKPNTQKPNHGSSFAANSIKNSDPAQNSSHTDMPFYDRKTPSTAQIQKEIRQKNYAEKPHDPITDEAAKLAIDFANGMLKAVDPDCIIVNKQENGILSIEVTSQNGATIGYKGEALDALEYLLMLAANKNDDKYYKVTVDCNGYRVKREQMLKAKATNLAEKAIKTGRKVVMEPMSNFSRKVVHAALADNNKVFTRSEGNEPNRHIVIIPKRR